MANEGLREEAAKLFRAALAQPGQHLASSHNNLGVMLAQMGQLNAAETEFLRSLAEPGVELREATHNLKLCRSLLATTNNLANMGGLTVSTNWHGRKLN